MAQKFVLDFEEKHHTLEVDGIEYEIPQRTAEIESKIKAHDEEITQNTEYDNNMSMLTILFGKEAAMQMFPDKDSTNLDKLSKCAKLALAAYYATLQDEKDRSFNEQMKSVKPYINDLEKVSKSIDRFNTAKFVNKKKK